MLEESRFRLIAIKTASSLSGWGPHSGCRANYTPGSRGQQVTIVSTDGRKTPEAADHNIKGTWKLVIPSHLLLRSRRPFSLNGYRRPEAVQHRSAVDGCP